jgi:hypothetical protein
MAVTLQGDPRVNLIASLPRTRPRTREGYGDQGRTVRASAAVLWAPPPHPSRCASPAPRSARRGLQRPRRRGATARQAPSPEPLPRRRPGVYARVLLSRLHTCVYSSPPVETRLHRNGIWWPPARRNTACVPHPRPSSRPTEAPSPTKTSPPPTSLSLSGGSAPRASCSPCCPGASYAPSHARPVTCARTTVPTDHCSNGPLFQRSNPHNLRHGLPNGQRARSG